jgi:hypothetical protein
MLLGDLGNRDVGGSQERIQTRDRRPHRSGAPDVERGPLRRGHRKARDDVEFPCGKAYVVGLDAA